MKYNELQKTGRLNKLKLIPQSTDPFWVAFNMVRKNISPIIFDCYFEEAKSLELNPFKKPLAGKDPVAIFGDAHNLAQNPETGESCLVAHLLYTANEQRKTVSVTPKDNGAVTLSFGPFNRDAEELEVTKHMIDEIDFIHAGQMASRVSANFFDTIHPSERDYHSILLFNKLASKKAFFEALKNKPSTQKGVAIRSTPHQQATFKRV